MILLTDIFEIIWISLVAYSAIQGYLLFFIFPSYSYGSKYSKRLLASLSLLCAVLLTHELVEETIGYEVLPHLIFVDAPLWYLLCPLIFFYIRLYCLNHMITWKDIVHLVPALWMVKEIAGFYQLNAAFKLQYLESMNAGEGIATSHNIHMILFCLQAIGYIVMSWIMIKRARKIDNDSIEYKWVVQLIVVLGFIAVMGFLSIVSLNWSLELIRFSWGFYTILISGFLLLLFLKTLKSPRELLLPKKRVTKRSFTNETYDLLLEFMNQYKPYRDPNFDIQSLANEMGQSKNSINLLIKERTGLSFREFINRYRVNEAKEILNSPVSKQFTIESIASDSGFTSLATFYRTFKKVEGTTPKAFIQS